MKNGTLLRGVLMLTVGVALAVERSSGGEADSCGHRGVRHFACRGFHAR